jgi:hypothetical protein
MNPVQWQERERLPAPVRPGGETDDLDQGPRRPRVERPAGDEILRRMRRVDPDQARRYNQRTGQ